MIGAAPFGHRAAAVSPAGLARAAAAGIGGRGCDLASPPPPPPPPPPSPPAADPHDDRLIELLEAPLAPGETASIGYRRKEEAIGAIFASLTVLESRALYARLTAARPGDRLALALARLTLERRQRLLAFLAGARRREALRLASRRA